MTNVQNSDRRNESHKNIEKSIHKWEIWEEGMLATNWQIKRKMNQPTHERPSEPKSNPERQLHCAVP